MEMLSCLPRSTMLMVEIQSHHHIIILSKDFDPRMCGFKAYSTCLASYVDIAGPQSPQNLINANESQAGNHPAPQSIPVAPTSTDIQDGNDPRCDFEELVSSPPDRSLCA
jgi:hypothetical protein